MKDQPWAAPASPGSNAMELADREVARATEDEVLTVDDLAALLRVNRKTIYEAYHRGELPGGRRIGRTIRFARSAVLAWLAEGDGPPRGRPPTRPRQAGEGTSRRVAR